MKSEDRERWGMMYCGGAPPVIAQLRALSSRHGISLKEESFGW